jgi:beta-glucosidase
VAPSQSHLFDTDTGYAEISAMYVAEKQSIRNAAHNILYATVNSNAMNGAAPGVVFKAITSLWWTLLLIADGVIMLLIVIGLVLIRRRVHSFSAAA